MTAARAMVQARGGNSLSFRELAKEIGIKSASAHYYFPTKGDLGAALARAYTDEFLAYLTGLSDAGKDGQRCIRDYTDVFRRPLLRDNRMGLGGILAAERPGLALEVRAEVERFPQRIAGWVLHVLTAGHPTMDLPAVKRWAYAIFSAIEGARLRRHPGLRRHRRRLPDGRPAALISRSASACARSAVRKADTASARRSISTGTAPASAC
jgi:TetR/AcrR family transcriptional repressor of nem operon